MHECRFGLKRLLIGAGVTAIPFALFGRAGSGGIVISTVVAASLFFLVMTARANQVNEILRLFGYAFFGGVAGWALQPTAFPPSGDNFFRMVCGTALGFILGLVMNGLVLLTERQDKTRIAAASSATQCETEAG